MIIEICSLEAALEAAEKAAGSTSVISVASLEDRDVVFPWNKNIRSVLHLKFNDLQAEFDEEGLPYGRPLPEQKDLDGLREFADRLQCERLIVHCGEGVSRSAAVAAAVYEYRSCRDTLCSGQAFKPNRLVYDLACRELGIRPGNLNYQPVAPGRYGEG